MYRNPRSVNMTPVWVLIAVNVLIFIATSIRPGALDVLSVSRSTISNQPWTIVSAMFAHANWSHILFNMLALYFYGMYALALVGEARFFIVYFIGGLVGNALFLLIANPLASAVGASGAIFALGGLLVVLAPRLKVMILPRAGSNGLVDSHYYPGFVVFSAWRRLGGTCRRYHDRNSSRLHFQTTSPPPLLRHDYLLFLLQTHYSQPRVEMLKANC